MYPVYHTSLMRRYTAEYPPLEPLPVTVEMT